MVLCVAVATLTLLAPSGKAKLPIGRNTEGRIIAYRPSERVIQMASFVENREAFLMLVEGRGRKKQAKVVKAQYRHIGYSEVASEVLEKASPLKWNLRRKRSCDQRYRDFVNDAPRLRDESGEKLMDRIAFVPGYERYKPADDHLLECYVLITPNSVDR